jgi:Recombination endonuclease VII
MAAKFCRDCGDYRPTSEFSKNARSRDGLAFYCREHLAVRGLRNRDARRTTPRVQRRPPAGLTIPDGQKWCPDCGEVLPIERFVRTVQTASGYSAYCKPCHNKRSRASREKVGGSRTYHLTRRYGITAAEADYLLEAQGGLCAVCRTAPASHVDHDHATGAVRELLCFNCNGGLGQFRDDPVVLRAAADYVERHRARQAAGEGSAGSRPGTQGRLGTPPVGSAQRRNGRSGGARRTGQTSRNSRQTAAGEADT